MQITRTCRWMSCLGAAGAISLLPGCAFVSYAVDPDVTACMDGKGKAHLMVQNIETVRGSMHTPFDDGNKSVNRSAYEIVVPLANGQWTETHVEVFAAQVRQEKTKGTVTVAPHDLSFDLHVAARDLPSDPSTPIHGFAAGRGEAYLRSAPTCAVDTQGKT